MNNIVDLIPHRDPFLFVDVLQDVSADKIVGIRTFKDEPFFQGHFPDYHIVPGVIIVEAMAQCGGAGARELGFISHEHLFFLATIDKVKFRKPTLPNTTLRFEVTNVKVSTRMIKQAGKAYHISENTEPVLAVEAEWMCLLGPNPNNQK